MLSLIRSTKKFENRVLDIVRHMGGGRPGGRPTFNWKEKRALGLDKEFGELKAGPFGYFEDIENHFAKDVEKSFIKLGDIEEYTAPDVPLLNRKKD